MFNKFLGKFSRDLGIDLGTSNTLIYLKDKGIVINEPSIVAINTKNDQIIAVGKEAQKMIGKTPPHIEAVHPLVDGVISDFEVAEKMLKYFIDKIYQETFSLLARPRVVIGIPLDITEVERKAVEDAVISAGAKEVLLIEQVMAAAIGARMPIQEPNGNMLVDLGGGTTEMAVISLGGVVTWKSLRLAGNELNNDIVQYIRNQFNVLLGEVAAEEIKMKIGSAAPLDDSLEMKVRGRDLITGLPKEITVNDSQIREAINRSIQLIIDDIKATLEITPPELVADIFERGMILTGGGAQLKNIDKAIAKATQIPIQIADDPLTCVVRGTGIVLEDIDSVKDFILTTTPEENLNK